MKYCPHCGKKVKKFKILHGGSYRGGGSYGSDTTLECQYCKWQFNLRRPRDVYGKIQRIKY